MYWHRPSVLDPFDEYSRFAVSRILARFPSWREYMLHRRPAGYAYAYADFELKSRSPATEQSLWVSTADYEITVGLHTHHSHFTHDEDRFNPAHIDAALDHVQDLLDERTVIVSGYVGDRFTGSTYRDVSAARQSSSLIVDVTRITLRSWLGTYDRDDELRTESGLGIDL